MKKIIYRIVYVLGKYAIRRTELYSRCEGRRQYYPILQVAISMRLRKKPLWVFMVVVF